MAAAEEATETGTEDLIREAMVRLRQKRLTWGLELHSEDVGFYYK